MRAALTLIELIFSMVIIALAFTILPKMMQLANRVGVHAVQEEALYNAIAYMGVIRSSAWDEENSRSDDILLSDGDPAYTCPYDGNYRRGGFVGSRNCRDKIAASATLGADSGEPPYDDMDDFTNVQVQNSAGSRSYELTVDVRYVEDLPLDESRFRDQGVAKVTNTKFVEINVTALTREASVGKRLGTIYYIGCNIGQLKINRYRWR